MNLRKEPVRNFTEVTHQRTAKYNLRTVDGKCASPKSQTNLKLNFVYIRLFHGKVCPKNKEVLDLLLNSNERSTELLTDE